MREENVSALLCSVIGTITVHRRKRRKSIVTEMEVEDSDGEERKEGEDSPRSALHGNIKDFCFLS